MFTLVRKSITNAVRYEREMSNNVLKKFTYNANICEALTFAVVVPLSVQLIGKHDYVLQRQCVLQNLLRQLVDFISFISCVWSGFNYAQIAFVKIFGVCLQFVDAHPKCLCFCTATPQLQFWREKVPTNI